MSDLIRDFKSKHPAHVLQPGEIGLIADLIIIYESVNGCKPNKKEIIILWEEYKP